MVVAKEKYIDIYRERKAESPKERHCLIVIGLFLRRRKEDE